MAPTADGAEIEWHAALEPRPIDLNDVSVECHLYDETSLSEAERRREEMAGV
jgi:hypothetical protein